MSRRKAVFETASVIVAGVVVGAVTSAVLRQTQTGVSAAYCIAAAIGVLAVGRLVHVVLVQTETPMRPAHGATHGRPRPVEILATSERRIAAAARERRLYLAGLQPALFELTRERLRLHGGIDLDAAIRAGTARDILGDELWTWLTIWDEDGPPPTPAELDRLVTRLEEL